MNFWEKLQANVGALLAGTTVDQLQADADATDAALRRENEDDLGRLGADWNTEVEANLSRGEVHAQQEIEAEFESGWRDGQENVKEFGRGVGRVVGDVAGSAASGLGAGAWEVFKKNWWWLLPAGIGAFFWFGGAALLPRRKKSA